MQDSIKHHVFAGALAMAACSANPLLAQNLVSNGSFEFSNPAFNDAGDGSVDGVEDVPVGGTSLTGWTAITATIERAINGNAYGLAASDGAYFLDLTGFFGNGASSGGITQTIPTSVGLTYQLALDLGTQQDTGNFSGPISVSASAGASTSTLTHNPGGSGNQWATYGFNFVATDATTAITIQGVAGLNYIGVDNVTVTAVPEPSNYALVGVGLLAFGVWRRCSRAKALSE